MVTRDEGYELGRGKEDSALDVVRDCIDRVMDLDAKVISDPERNKRHGDLEMVGTAECKGQPIDPERYDRNFVEVFEDVSSGAKDHHRDGFARTATILAISVEQLAAVRYQDRRQSPAVSRVLGVLPYVSASLVSVDGSDLTIYANADPARTFVYFYTKRFLLDRIREQVLAGQMRRGMGRSNEDTFGVLVPVSPARWRRVDGTWHYVGPGEPPITKIRAAMRREA